MKKYKIGTAAKQSGVTPQTIRFYESRDLIQSFKEEFSSTRYYGARHFKQLANIRRYFKQGFSEGEVAGLLACQSLEEMQALYAAQRRACREEIEQLMARLDSLDRQLDDIRKVDSLYGRIVEEESPLLHMLITRRGDEMDESPEVEDTLSRWIEQIHLVRASSIIPQDTFVHHPSDGYRFSGYCAFPQDLARLSCGPGDVCLRAFAPRRCLHTVCALIGKDISPMRLMPHVYAYLEAHSLAVDGDIFGSCIAVLDEQKNKTDYKPGATYYEYWIPVKDA